MATQGFENINLPQFFQSPGQALQGTVALQERQKDRDIEERHSQQEQQQQNRMFNLKQIDQQTAFDKFAVGQQAIDNYSQKQLSNIASNALSNYINLDPAEMQYRLQKDLQPLFQWDTMAKTQYGNIENTIKDLNKTYPNIDISKAYDIAMNKFAGDYMKMDANGQPTAKNPLEIRPMDYRAMFESPDVLGEITQDTSPFQNFITGSKLRTIGGKEVTDNKGNVQSYKWSGGISPFAQETLDEQNRPTDRKIKSETLDLGNGNKLEMFPEEDTHALLSNPPVRAALFKKWKDYKQSKGLQFQDANTESRMFRKYIRDEIGNVDLSYVKPEETEKTPKPPSVNINLGMQQRDQANQIVDGLTSAIQNKDPNALRQYSSFLRRNAGSPFKINDVFMLGDKAVLQYWKDTGNGKRKLEEVQFDANDPYLRDKIIGEYQKDLGSSNPVETLPFVAPKVNIQSSQTGNKPKYQGLDAKGNPIYK